MSISFLILGLLGCDPTPSPPGLPYFDSPEFTPRWLTEAEVPAGFHQIPSFSLTNHHGAAIDEADLDGKITVADFFFASCSGVCPKLRESMVQIDEAFPPDADLVLLSHSVTPSKDTVQVLREYADKHGIDSPRWHLLTGDRQEIYDLARHAYFAEDDRGEARTENDFLHTESIVLLDRKRRVRGVYAGVNKAAVRQLIADARTLLRQQP